MKWCPNSKLYLFGTYWIDKSVYLRAPDFGKKQFAISTIASAKNCKKGEGYRFRRAIHESQSQFSPHLSITFFRSSRTEPLLNDYGKNPLLLADKNVLFEKFQFAIVIENSKQTNYFTEKLIDCLVTRTIPIYWGCPNIATFFDITGWIVLENSDLMNLRERLLALHSGYYSLHEATIEKNYAVAIKYTDFVTNVNNAIDVPHQQRPLRNQPRKIYKRAATWFSGAPNNR